MIIGIDASLACRGERTGVESYAFHIILHLASVIPVDIEVRLYSDREFPVDLKKNIPASWKQIVLHWPPRFLWTQVRLSFEMLMHSPDILFTPGHVEPLIHPKCTVMMVHDVAAWRFPDAYSRFNRWYTLGLTLKAYRTNSLMLVPSTFTQQELEKLALERGVQKKVEIKVIPHGYVDKYHDESGSLNDLEVFSHYGIKKHTPYVIGIGRVEYKKNIDTIIRAFEQLKRSRTEFTKLKLVLVGKPGYGYENIKKIMSESLYREDIIETGWLPDGQVSLLLQHAKAFVFVSRYEGFGFPILEALSLGVPVIASKDLCLEEVGGKLVTYVLSTSEDEIAEAIANGVNFDSAIRFKLKEDGRAHVAQFSWAQSAKTTYNTFLKAYKIAGTGEDVV